MAFATLCVSSQVVGRYEKCTEGSIGRVTQNVQSVPFLIRNGDLVPVVAPKNDVPTFLTIFLKGISKKIMRGTVKINFYRQLT